MAREYGNDRAASTTIRLSQQEKELIRKEAQARGMSISQIIREAISYYVEEKQKNILYAEYVKEKQEENNIKRFKEFVEYYNNGGAQ